MKALPAIQFGKILVGNTLEIPGHRSLKRVSLEAAEKFKANSADLIKQLEAQGIDIFLSSGYLDADPARPYYTTTYFIAKPSADGIDTWEVIDTCTSTKSHFAEEMAEGAQLLLDELK